MTARLLQPLFTALAVALVVFVSVPSRASALGDGTGGRISGTVEMGTAGVALPEITVSLLAVGSEGASSAGEQTTTDGSFAFDVEPDPDTRYLVRVRYQEIEYLSTPVTLTPETPEAERTLVVYETTSEQPDLRIETTVVTAVELNREQGELTLLRQDAVRNPGDRVYVGGEDGTTLRVPAPDGAVQAGALSEFETARLEGQVVVSGIPLRPGLTTVSTAIRVQYDRVEDRYVLRVTAPLPTERLAARIPSSFVRDVEPLEEASLAAGEELQGEDLVVVERTGGVREGEALLVAWQGLAGSVATNPLTEPGGAALGAGVALALLLGAGGAVLWWRSRPARAAEQPAGEAEAGSGEVESGA